MLWERRYSKSNVQPDTALTRFDFWERKALSRPFVSTNPRLQPRRISYYLTTYHTFTTVASAVILPLSWRTYIFTRVTRVGTGGSPSVLVLFTWAASRAGSLLTEQCKVLLSTVHETTLPDHSDHFPPHYCHNLPGHEVPVRICSISHRTAGTSLNCWPTGSALVYLVAAMMLDPSARPHANKDYRSEGWW